MHAVAPSAIALSTSVPRRTPPSSSTSILPSTASTTSGSAEMAERTPSSWRPPWLETITASTPCCAASLASSGSRMPLSARGPPQMDFAHSMSFQRDRLIELGVDETGDGEHVVSFAGGPDKIGKRHPRAGEEAPYPAGMQSEIDQVRQAGGSGGMVRPLCTSRSR